MAGIKEDNTVLVLQKAIRKFKIKVSNTSVKELLLAHPHYPTLKSVCNLMEKWGIEHYPLKLSIDEIIELGRPFIAHLKLNGGQLVYIDKIENGSITYYSGKKNNHTEDFEKFSEKLSGAVVVFEANEKSGEKDYTRKRQNEILNISLLPFSLLAVLFFALLSYFSNSSAYLHQPDLTFWALVVTKLIGLTASIFLIMHELKIHNPLADKICGFGSKTDCDSVLSSNASRLFGWANWADVGLIFFSGSHIYLLGSFENKSLCLLAIISVLSLPYPIFSIYYQSVKLKKWCPFCLVVQVVLITEFIILYPALKTITFSGYDILRIAVSFIIPAAIWLVFKAYKEKSRTFDKEHYSFLQFKRNPNIFRFLLKENGFSEFAENENSLILGNPNATITVTVFLSLYCNPCADAFQKLKTLLVTCSDLKINAIFAVYEDTETQKLIDTIYYLHTEKGAVSSLDYIDKWYSMPKQLSKTLYSKEATQKNTT